MSNSPIPSEWWRGILREHRASGLSVAAFCRRARVSPASFYSWRRKLQNGAVPSPGSGPRRSGVHPFLDGSVRPNRGGRGLAGSKVAGFVEVKLPPEAMAEARAIELRLPGDRCLLIRPGFDRSTLVDLLATLESCAADPRNAPFAELDGVPRLARHKAHRRISSEARR